MKNENKINRPEDSQGQNPQWPGEKLIKPNTIIVDEKRDEKTVVPIVDSITHKKNTTT